MKRGKRHLNTGGFLSHVDVYFMKLNHPRCFQLNHRHIIPHDTNHTLTGTLFCKTAADWALNYRPLRRTHARACPVLRHTGGENTAWVTQRWLWPSSSPSTTAAAVPSRRLPFLLPCRITISLIETLEGVTSACCPHDSFFSLFILLKRPLCLLDPLSKSPSFMDTSLVLLSLSLSCFPNGKWKRSYDNVRVSSESAEFRCIWLKPFCFLVIMWGTDRWDNFHSQIKSIQIVSNNLSYNT